MEVLFCSQKLWKHSISMFHHLSHESESLPSAKNNYYHSKNDSFIFMSTDYREGKLGCEFLLFFFMSLVYSCIPIDPILYQVYLVLVLLYFYIRNVFSLYSTDSYDCM